VEIGSVLPAIQQTQLPADRVGGAQTPPQAVSKAASEFFISPVLRFDSRSLTVIFQVRDSGSGDVVRQFPPEAVVERYRQDASSKPFVVTYPGAGSGADRSEEAEPGQTEDSAVVDFSSPPAADAGSPAGTGAAAQAVNPLAGQPVDLVA